MVNTISPKIFLNAYNNLKKNCFPILLDAGIIPNLKVQDPNGNTILHYIAYSNDINTLTLLFNYQKTMNDSINLKNNNNKSALDVAIDYNGINSKIVKLLQNYVSDVKSNNVDDNDNNYSVEQNTTELLEEFKKNTDKVLSYKQNQLPENKSIYNIDTLSSINNKNNDDDDDKDEDDMESSIKSFIAQQIKNKVNESKNNDDTEKYDVFMSTINDDNQRKENMGNKENKDIQYNHISNIMRQIYDSITDNQSDTMTVGDLNTSQIFLNNNKINNNIPLLLNNIQKGGTKNNIIHGSRILPTSILNGGKNKETKTKAKKVKKVKKSNKQKKTNSKKGSRSIKN
jgi:hypothetical protein